MLTAALLSLALAQSDAPMLRVHIVDERGALLVDGWSVHSLPIGEYDLEEVRLNGLFGPRTAVDPAEGSAVIELERGGRVLVWATHASGAATPELVIEPSARGATGVELQCADPTAERMLVVTVQLPLPILNLTPGALVARSRAGTELNLEFDPAYKWHGAWVVRDVEPDLYTIEVRDPRLALTRVAAVSSGTLARVEATAGASARLRFVQEETGLAVAPERLVVRHRIGGDYCEQEHAWGAGGAGAGLLSGLVAVDVECDVWFRDRPPLRVPLTGLEVGVTLERTVVVPRGVRLAGRVVDRTGEPVEGVSIGLCTDGVVRRGPVERRSQPEVRSGPTPSLVFKQHTLTDARGRYQFDDAPPGPVLVMAQFHPWSGRTDRVRATTSGCASLNDDAAAVIDAAGDLVVVTPELGAVDLRIPDHSRFKSTELELWLKPEPGRWLRSNDAESLHISPDGTLRLRGLPLTLHRLVLERTVGAKRRAARLEFTPRAGETLVVTVDTSPLGALR